MTFIEFRKAYENCTIDKAYLLRDYVNMLLLKTKSLHDLNDIYDDICIAKKTKNFCDNNLFNNRFDLAQYVRFLKSNVIKASNKSQVVVS